MTGATGQPQGPGAACSPDAPRGLPIPVFVVDPELSVLERNLPAGDLIRERRGLSMMAGQLRIARHEEHQLLIRTVGRVVGQASLRGEHGVTVTADPPLHLRVRALAGGRSIARASRVAVYVLEERHHAALERLFGAVYGFAPAEAAIVRSLLEGMNVEAIAGSLSVSRFAVERQLRMLCRKTATHDDAELAACIVASLAVVR